MPLFVCATPIGNLDDVTLRLLAVLRKAELVLCEDTRRTRVLLDRHGIPGARARLKSYHRHNEAQRVAEVLPRLRQGACVALVADAGMPGIGDPGIRLVAASIEAGVEVTVLPGPSAVESSVVVAGFPCPGYRFLGWLPRRAAELSALWPVLDGVDVPCVAFESPKRLPTALASLASARPAREVAVCRELTKVFEEVVRGSAKEVAERFAESPKGEITVVIGPAPADRGGGPADAGAAGRALDELAAAVQELVASGATRRTASEVVGRLSRTSHRDLYRRSL